MSDSVLSASSRYVALNALLFSWFVCLGTHLPHCLLHSPVFTLSQPIKDPKYLHKVEKGKTADVLKEGDERQTLLLLKPFSINPTIVKQPAINHLSSRSSDCHQRISVFPRSPIICKYRCQSCWRKRYVASSFVGFIFVLPGSFH